MIVIRHWYYEEWINSSEGERQSTQWKITEACQRLYQFPYKWLKSCISLIQIERRQFNDKWDSDFGPTHLSTLPLRQACGMGEMVQTLNINYSFRLHGVKSCACQWWDQMKIIFFDIFHNFHLWLLMIVNICDIWFHILHNISCD